MNPIIYLLNFPHQFTLYPSGFNTKRFKVYFDTNDTQKSLKPISPLLKGVQEPHEELMAGEGVWLVAGDAVERSNSIRITEPNRITVLFHSDSFLFAVFRHMEMVHREKQYDMVKVTK